MTFPISSQRSHSHPLRMVSMLAGRRTPAGLYFLWAVAGTETTGRRLVKLD